MGKSYRRRHYVKEYDSEYDHRSLKKEHFQNCKKHGDNLIVKRGTKTELCKSCSKIMCDEDIRWKFTSHKHEKNKLLNFAIEQIEY